MLFMSVRQTCSRMTLISQFCRGRAGPEALDWLLSDSSLLRDAFVVVHGQQIFRVCRSFSGVGHAALDGFSLAYLLFTWNRTDSRRQPKYPYFEADHSEDFLCFPELQGRFY